MTGPGKLAGPSPERTGLLRLFVPAWFAHGLGLGLGCRDDL